MDIDPMEYVPEDDEEKKDSKDKASREESRKSRLNSYVAIAVALLATFLGICNVKDDNIVQAMQQAQADKIDQWGYYQARNIRELIAQTQVDQLKLQAMSHAADRAAYDRQITAYQKMADEQEEKKKQTKADAEGAEKKYDALNIHDDQFDLCNSAISIAIALLALTALTQKRWLFGLAMIPTVFGVLMGLAGLLGWGLHPDALSRLLS